MWLLIFCFLNAYLQGWRGTQSRHFATTHYVCVPPLPLPQATVVLIQSSHAPPKLFVIGLEHPPPSLDFLCATRTGMWCCRPPYQHTHALVPVMSIPKKFNLPFIFIFLKKRELTVLFQQLLYSSGKENNGRNCTLKLKIVLGFRLKGHRAPWKR